MSFNPKKTDIDEYIDLINTLGDMVDEKKRLKWKSSYAYNDTDTLGQNPPIDQEADEAYTYNNTNNYYHNDNYTAPGQN